MSLTQKVQNVYMAAVGNRLTLLSTTGYVACQILPYSSYHPDHSWSDISLALGHAVTGILCGFVAGATLFGKDTARIYRRTDKHIKEHGSLDIRFAKTLISGYEKNKFFGYCQLRGL